MLLVKSLAAMSNYTSLVNIYSSDLKGKVFSNFDMSHASVVIQQMFEISTDKVFLLTDCLNEQCYNRKEILQAAVSFLRRNPKAVLKIICRDCFEPTNQFIASLKLAGLSKQVELYVFKQEEVKPEYNFMVADGVHYRFEHNRKDHSAHCAFYDKLRAERLVRDFEVLKNKSLYVAF